MSLGRNIVASVASQLYVALIGIVMVPMYVMYMGAEAYGLVGFFAMLLAWFNLLDIGLTPTIARQAARFRGGAIDALTYRRLVRAFETAFVAVALVGGVAIFAAADYIAVDWLRASQLATEQVLAAIQLMAPIVAIRWMAGLYRGALSGAERLVWLGGFNAAIATLRFCGVLPLLMFVGTSPALFFTYQLATALVELGVLAWFAYRSLPDVPAGERLQWTLAPLKPVFRFSLMIAFTSSVWVFVTQTDKLVLSRILPLAEYGYFTLAVLVASGIQILSGPVGNAIMPRMANLEAQGHHAQMIDVYRHATQLVAIVAGAAAITVAHSAEALLWAWTGDAEIARAAAPVLVLYALGNGVLAVSAFPFYLQFAKGDMLYHVIGNAVFVVLLIPLVVWAASTFGGVGAGYVWLGMNLVAFVAWLPLVHRKFAPGLNLRWYLEDVGVIVAPAALVGYAVSLWLPPSGSRLDQFAHILLVGGSSLIAGVVASSAFRTKARALLRTPLVQQS
ncbi:MAG: oligosaccharide flippase family protein [Burkholderiales bacterium]|nr:oligosaccharide flippase family protein [Burkholderiales bacterium]